MSDHPRNPFSAENRLTNTSDASQASPSPPPSTTTNGYSTPTDSPLASNTEEAWKLVISDNVEETRDSLMDLSSSIRRDTSSAVREETYATTATTTNTTINNGSAADIQLEGESASDARQFNHYQSEVILRPSTLTLSHHDSSITPHYNKVDTKEELTEKTGDEEEFLENIL
jgi:hypothetical protein